MNWDQKLSDEDKNEKYIIVLKVIKKNPGIFFSDIKSMTGIPSKILRFLLKNLVLWEEVRTEKKLNKRWRSECLIYYVKRIKKTWLKAEKPLKQNRLVKKRSDPFVDEEHLKWMAFYSLPRAERMRMRMSHDSKS